MELVVPVDWGQARMPRGLTPSRWDRLGGSHPGDGAVPRSRPSPALASSPGHRCSWALRTSCPSGRPPGVALPGLLTALQPSGRARPAGLFLAGCRMSRQTGGGLHVAALHTGMGHVALVVRGGPKMGCPPRATLSTLVSLFRDRPVGPHRLEPATAPEGPGRGGVLGVLLCLALSSHRALSRVCGPAGLGTEAGHTCLKPASCRGGHVVHEHTGWQVWGHWAAP